MNFRNTISIIYDVLNMYGLIGLGVKRIAIIPYLCEDIIELSRYGAEMHFSLLCM